MKKFMFSAVALVAFSFAGMANTGEVEKNELKINEINHNFIELKTETDSELLKISIKIISETPCADAAGVLMNFLMDEMNFTFSQAWRFSQVAFNKCMQNTYNTNSLE